MAKYVEDKSLEQATSQAENETKKQILVLEKQFREHNTLVKNEIEVQRELVTRLLTLCQRYSLLESTETGRRYPEIYQTPAEDVFLLEFTEKLKQIKNSNFRIINSLDDLKQSCLVFESMCAELDMTIESPLIIGDAFHKPIAYFIELISDLFKYFHAWLLKLKFSSRQLDPKKIDSVANYKQLLELSEEFEEHLNIGLTYCKCLRSKTKN